MRLRSKKIRETHVRTREHIGARKKKAVATNFSHKTFPTKRFPAHFLTNPTWPRQEDEKKHCTWYLGWFVFGFTPGWVQIGTSILKWENIICSPREPSRISEVGG